MGVTVFQGDTVNEVWVKAYNALATMAENSFKDPSRDGPVVGEICDAVFCVADPTRNIVSSEIRRLPMRYAVGELLWYLSGSDRTADIAQFASKWNDLSDDGIHANSAYGYRIFERFGFDQWEHIRDMLMKDPNTRQAVIHIKDASNCPTKDVPCTVYLQFLLRNKRLNLSVHMRSNDIWMGVPYDMFSFCALQMLMAMEIDVKVGEYTHYAGSLHMYERDYLASEENIKGLTSGDTCNCDAASKSACSCFGIGTCN